MTARGTLGLWSGIGIVAASMIGAGVFLSAGFMAQHMSAGWILLAWLIGGGLAMAGAYAYADVARRVPRSGGEYRYLTDLFHPAVGYLAGWASLLVGFSAPSAINAFSAAAFVDKVSGIGDVRVVGSMILIAMTALHAFDLRVSKLAQDGLIVVKVVLLLGFVGIGLCAGSWSIPAWQPPAQLTAGHFAGDLFYVAFAFSGWNAAVYAAEQFREPARDVPRSMLIGCAVVGVFYLIVNWVFVANISPERAAVVLRYEKDYVTLAHVVATDLVGPTAATFVSLLAIIAFVSAISAMMMVGPRIASAMASDGLLPRVFAERHGKPPIGSVLFQGGVAVLLLWSHSVRAALKNVGAIIVLFSALTVACLFWVKPRARRVAMACGAIYVALSAWMLYHGFRDSPTLLLWSGAVAVIALGAYVVTGRKRGPGGGA